MNDKHPTPLNLIVHQQCTIFKFENKSVCDNIGNGIELIDFDIAMKWENNINANSCETSPYASTNSKINSCNNIGVEITLK